MDNIKWGLGNKMED
jgi:hypothetical protein